MAKARTNSALHGPSGIVVRVSDDYKTATVEGPIDIISGMVNGVARSLSGVADDSRRRAQAANPARSEELTREAKQQDAWAAEWWKFSNRVYARQARRWR